MKIRATARGGLLIGRSPGRRRGLDRQKFAARGLQKSGLGTFEFRVAADAGGQVEVLGHAKDTAVQLRHAPLRRCDGDAAAVVWRCRGRAEELTFSANSS